MVLLLPNHDVFRKRGVIESQDKLGGAIYPVCNPITKAYIPGRALPFILVISYVALLKDKDGEEYLAIPFQLM